MTVFIPALHWIYSQPQPPLGNQHSVFQNRILYLHIKVAIFKVQLRALLRKCLISSQYLEDTAAYSQGTRRLEEETIAVDGRHNRGSNRTTSTCSSSAAFRSCGRNRRSSDPPAFRSSDLFGAMRPHEVLATPCQLFHLTDMHLMIFCILQHTKHCYVNHRCSLVMEL